MKHLPPSLKKYQKIVIGPWSHQSIGTRSTGDMRILPDGRDHRYPMSVIQPFNIPDEPRLNVQRAVRLAASELVGWFRYFLGTPTFQLPPDTAWQYLGSISGQEVYIQMPADTFRADYYSFYNFMNGVSGLNNFPIAIRFGVNGAPETRIVSIPATGRSVFGETAPQPISALSYEFDATQPNGIPNVRFYVVGPVADSLNPSVGNYWYSADTFPLPNLPRLRLYLRGDGRLTEVPPSEPESPRAFVANPLNPVLTHGGPNMIVRTPDNSRPSEGQMDFADPAYRSIVLDRPATYIVNGQNYSDLIAYVSDYVPESLCIAGFSVVQLYMALKPLWGPFPDSANGDVIVRILDVYPDGREYYVFEGACNARAREYAESLADGEEDTSKPWYNLVADSIYKWRFRTLPIAYCWGKGHRIKVLVSATNYPRYQACPNVPLMPGEFYRRRPFDNNSYEFHGVAMEPRQNLQTIYSSPDKLSYIEFPVLGGRFISGLSGHQEKEKVQSKVYPNPAQGSAVVEVFGEGVYDAEVYTVTGERIFKAEFAHRVGLPVKEWLSGVYVVRVSGKDGHVVGIHKLVVQ